MPLDSNLPTYYFKPPHDKARPHESTLLFTQFDSDPEPRYTHKYFDPWSPQARNCYDVAIADPFVPDVIFGEILVKPEWTHPTLSAEEIRKNGGVPPPPAPIIPRAVTVQLYGPDQQIIMEEEKGSWGTGPSYHFSMPQQTFRLPSSSALDYSSNDPAADPSTPQINFLWKKDGRKDLKCYVTGKTTDKGKKKKGGKEPPIIVAMFRDFDELTIYEPNLHRVEMEDYKGLEVVLLLTATVVRDIYCGYKKDCFNAGQAPRKNSGGVLGKKSSMPLLHTNGSTLNVLSPAQPQSNGLPTSNLARRRQSIPQPARAESYPPGVPPPDPRQQWEIDAETARLQKLYTSERQAEERRRRERVQRDEEEARRIQKQLEKEEKERRKKQADVDKESARLMKLYGNQQNLAPVRPVANSGQRISYPSWGHSHSAPPPQQARPRPPQQNYQGPYLQPNGLATQSSFLGRPQVRPQHLHPAASSANLMMSGARPPAPRPRPELKPKKSSLLEFFKGN